MDHDDHAYLIDFDAVKDLAKPGDTVVGTFGYMAPEQFSNHVKPISDLYALGVTLIEMVKPGGVSESVRMFGITRELCAGLPAAGNLNPIMQFSRWLHMEGVEIAEFHGDLRMKGRK